MLRPNQSTRRIRPGDWRTAALQTWPQLSSWMPPDGGWPVVVGGERTQRARELFASHLRAPEPFARAPEPFALADFRHDRLSLAQPFYAGNTEGLCV